MIKKVELFLLIKCLKTRSCGNAQITKVPKLTETLFLVISSVEASMFPGSSDLLNVKQLIQVVRAL